MDNRNAQPTKKGPGLKHGHKVKHGKAPQLPVGRFAGQHTNPHANARQAVKADIGARQYRKQRKALSFAAREQA